jgi:hypothetical protein
MLSSNHLLFLDERPVARRFHDPSVMFGEVGSAAVRKE